MLFGVYLVDRGVITTDQFFETFKCQLSTRPQLGALAVRMHELSSRHVEAILGEQSETPGELFGDTAVRLGFLSEDDLIKLLRKQTSRMTPFSTLLVELGYLAKDEVERHLAAYHASKESATAADLQVASA
jgi:hypothetical protein